MTEILKRKRDKIRQDRWWVLLLFLINLGSISAILRANIQYRDDAGRTYEGYAQWYRASRYLNDLLAVFLNAGRRLADISPLPQILAVALMTIAGYLLIELFSKDGHIRLIQIICVLPLMINPYFAACMAYKFDAPFMALSVLFGILPFVWYGRGKWPFFIAAFVCTLGTCLTYQASTGFFPMLVVFYFLSRWIDGKQTAGRGLLWCLKSAIAYVAALIVYRIFIVHEVPRYSASHMFALRDLPAGVWKNYISYFEKIGDDYKRIWYILTWMVVLCFLLSVMMQTVKNRALSLLGGSLALLAGSVFAYGAYLFLEDIDFRPRMMYGVGLLTAIIGTFIARDRRKAGWPGKLATAALAWCFFIYFFVFGNALYDQKEYTFYRLETLITDLNNLEIMQNGQEKDCQFKGSIKSAPVVRQMFGAYPVLRREIPATGGEDMWATYYFVYYPGVPGLKYAQTDMTDLNLPVLKETMFHTIAGDETHLLITFK